MDFPASPTVDQNFRADVGNGSWIWTGKIWRRGFTPAPVTLTLLTPDSMFFGVNFDQVVQIDGTGFWPNSLVYLDDLTIPATYVSDTQFIITINAVNEPAARDAMVRVDASNELPFHFTAATTAPNFQSIDPTECWNNALSMDITCNGVGFHPAAKAIWDGVEQANTVYIDPNEIMFNIDATALPTGVHQVGVTNGPGLASTVTCPFTINW